MNHVKTDQWDESGERNICAKGRGDKRSHYLKRNERDRGGERERNGQRTTCSGPQGISDLGTGVSES